jgi:hypothetical protein
MTKSKTLLQALKRAALAAALFLFPALWAGTDEPMAAGAIVSRTQALYDQAVKLHRRYAGNPRHPVEPLKSILTEISLYHDTEKASYLELSGTAGQPGLERSAPVAIGPWAQWQLALLDLEEKDFEQAISDYHDLGERFKGLKVVEPAEGAFEQPADLVALSGEIEATLDFAQTGGIKGATKALAEKIALLQEKFGQAPQDCKSCGGSSALALQYLWRALALDQAKASDWAAATRGFVKREKTKDYQAAVLLALAQGWEKLGKGDEAKKIRADLAKNYSAALPGEALPQGIFSNLLPAQQP